MIESLNFFNYINKKNDSEKKMKKNYSWHQNEYFISTDQQRLDLTLIHEILAESKWAKNISFETVKLSIENSLCFGLYHHDKQVGFARFITDYATFAYLCDVFIVEQFQGLGLSKWLMQCCLEHHDLQKLRRIMLVTSSAPWLYEKVGFTAQNKENFVWEIVRPEIYNSQ